MTLNTTRRRTVFIIIVFVTAAVSFSLLRKRALSEKITATPNIFSCSDQSGLEFSESDQTIWSLSTEEKNGVVWVRRIQVGKVEGKSVRLNAGFSFESKIKEDFLTAFLNCRNSNGEIAATRWDVPGLMDQNQPTDHLTQEKPKAVLLKGLLVPGEKSIKNYQLSKEGSFYSDGGYTMTFYGPKEAKLEIGAQIIYQKSSCEHYLAHIEKLKNPVPFKWKNTNGVIYNTIWRDGDGIELRRTIDLLYNDGNEHCQAISAAEGRFTTAQLISLLKSFHRAP